MLDEKREIKKDPGSFRDPASQVYTGQGMVFREIDRKYLPEYDKFIKSGLYQELLDEDLIIPHGEVHRDIDHAMLEADLVPFISYPYEWSFAQIQEAALVTLRINRIARDHGMMLKDASAFNIQYYKGRLLLIDTASFMTYRPGAPWHPYSQFLRHFVCPLVIMKYDHANNGKLSQLHIDGIPIPEAVHRVPFRKRFNTGIVTHLLSQSMNFSVNEQREVHWSAMVFDSLLANLEKWIGRLKYKPVMTSDFMKYSECNIYSPAASEEKSRIVGHCISRINGKRFIDLGCNTGEYSHLAVNLGKEVIAVDNNHDCIHSLHGLDADILPLIVDVTNPSPGIGWANQERKPFWERVGEVDCIMGLALIHHLCIRHNIPLGMIADLFAEHALNLIIEWIPPEDPNVRTMVGTKDIPAYDSDTFIEEFSRKFQIIRKYRIKGAGRYIFLMEKKNGK